MNYFITSSSNSNKIIKKGDKEYYYHNIKVDGRVNNTCLGSSEKELNKSQEVYIQFNMYTYTTRGDRNLA